MVRAITASAAPAAEKNSFYFSSPGPASIAMGITDGLAAAREGKDPQSCTAIFVRTLAVKLKAEFICSYDRMKEHEENMAALDQAVRSMVAVVERLYRENSSNLSKSAESFVSGTELGPYLQRSLEMSSAEMKEVEDLLAKDIADRHWEKLPVEDGDADQQDLKRRRQTVGGTIE